MQEPSSPKSNKIGCLYKAIYVERFVAIIDETEYTLKLWFYPTNTFTIVSKEEFLTALSQNQFEFVEKMPYDIVQSINMQSTKNSLKNTYDDYYRRKQSIISSEL